jgi:glycosyl transferase, family 25
MTVFEDDAVVHSRFDELSAAVLSTLLPDWHLCLWGWNFDAMMLFDLMGIGVTCATAMDAATLRRSLPAFQVSDIAPRASRLSQFHGTVSYAISPAGATALRSRCIPVPDISVEYFCGTLPNNGIDRTINAVLDHINAYVCFPPLVATPNERERSTVHVAADTNSD